MAGQDPNYSLTQLRGFVAVAEELHYGRAAQRLGMTQPPLSRQIQSLERAVGVKLLDRGGRSVSLTAAGESFLRDAREMLALVHGAQVSAQRVTTGETGTVRLGFTPIGAYAVLGEVLGWIARELPALDVELHELVSEEQNARLTSGLLDLGLVRPRAPSGLASRLLHSERLVVAVPADHHLAAGPGPVLLSDITDAYIGYSPEGSTYLRSVCAAMVGVESFIDLQITSQVSTMLALVRAGRGFALVPRSCSAMHLDGVVYRELDESDAHTVDLLACWNPKSTNPALRRLVGHLDQLPCVSGRHPNVDASARWTDMRTSSMTGPASPSR